MFGTQQLDANIKDGRTAFRGVGDVERSEPKKMDESAARLPSLYPTRRFSKKTVRVDTNTMTRCSTLGIDEPHDTNF